MTDNIGILAFQSIQQNGQNSVFVHCGSYVLLEVSGKSGFFFKQTLTIITNRVQGREATQLQQRII